MSKFILLFQLLFIINLSFSQISITLQPDAANGKDAMVHGLPSLVNTNWANEEQFPASAWTHNGIFGIIRSLIEFDLSFVPANSVINNAQLSLYAIDNQNGLGYHDAINTTNEGWIERVTTSWNESSVTWNTQPQTTPQNRVSLPASTNPQQNYTNINVTNLVQDIINNPSSGFGFMLKLNNESIYRRLNFCSSDHNNPQLRPKLQITYTPNINNDTCYTMQPGGDKGKDALLHGVPYLSDTNWETEMQFPATAWTFNGEFGIVRSVIEFDVSFIPANAMITKAWLSLYAIDFSYGMGYHSALSGSNEGWLEKITTPWDESTVTWNNQPATTTLNRVYVPASTNQTQNYININVTQLMQEIISNPATGHGFMLKLEEESIYRKLNFCSSDHYNAALRPKLEICYTTSANTANIAENSFKIYPNPFKDELNIEFSNKNSKLSRIFIYNAIGKMMHAFQLSENYNKIDLSSLPCGMYFYIIEISDSISKTGKIVKQF